ncbi:hypothetical protein MKD38_06250 [Cupriavidus sp. WGlv3]|uniref:hypothetical protein n=1 Tax=Cupriavidus sp. WGlv3 TaxID=2919924 RepID=UPI00208FFD44|nr:hypothetical protein [Cupriavidus sp. WGlv3]MCO4861263.1 hypothetical protein [Cupriavidus sp. WGlv3]
MLAISKSRKSIEGIAHTRLGIKETTLAIASTLCLIPICANAGTSMAGIAGIYQTSVALDACTSVNLTINVSEDGGPSVNASSNNGPSPFASALLSGFNSCTDTSFLAIGDTTAIQFSATRGNPGQPPKTVSASGTIPLTDLFSNAADSLNFHLTLTQFGGVFSQQAHSHDTVTNGTSSVTTHLRADFQASFANASVSAVSQIFGQIPASGGNTFASVAYLKSHEVTISK